MGLNWHLCLEGVQGLLLEGVAVGHLNAEVAGPSLLLLHLLVELGPGGEEMAGQEDERSEQDSDHEGGHYSYAGPVVLRRVGQGVQVVGERGHHVVDCGIEKTCCEIWARTTDRMVLTFSIEEAVSYHFGIAIVGFCQNALTVGFLAVHAELGAELESSWQVPHPNL